MTYLITTAQKSNNTVKERARQLAEEYDCTYVNRGKLSIDALWRDYSCSALFVLSDGELKAYFSPHEDYHFHLSMAQLRILRIARGGTDHLIDAVRTLIGEEPNFSLLDCTMGLASDSIVLSYAFPSASVQGCESFFPLWFATRYGLSHYIHEQPEITRALRRIKCEYGDFRTLLSTLGDNAVSVVYIDPMFEIPVCTSPQFKSLRGHVTECEITGELLDEAKRVSTSGVIIKERPFASLFKMLPPDRWEGGRYSRIRYGIYTKES